MAGYTFSEPSELKTIILFIIYSYGEPLDNGIITDIFMSHEFVDYFTMQVYLDELVKADLIEIFSDEKNNKYLLTDIGREAVSGFSGTIPTSVRENILHSIKDYRIHLDKGRLVSAKYIKHSEIDHEAHLCVNEGASVLLDISVNAGSMEGAKRICRNFKKNPQKIYEDVLKVLSE